MPFLNAIVYGFNNFFNFRGKVAARSTGTSTSSL